MKPTATSERTGNARNIESYDFRQPMLFSNDVMRTVRALHEVCAKNLSRVFSNALRNKVNVRLQKIDQLSTSDFINKLETPNALYLLSIDEMGGEVIVAMPPGFCIHIVEKQSGGRGEDLTEFRALTTIEEKIMRRVIFNFNREIQNAWDPHMKFEISSFSYESKPENIQIDSADPCIVARFEVELGEQQVEIQVSYPYSMLKKALNDSVLRKGNQENVEKLSHEEMNLFKKTLTNAVVNVQPLLGNTRLTLQEVLSLKEGDSLMLNQRTDRPLEVRINGVKKMTAYPGLARGRKAVKVFEMIEEINEQELI